MDIDVAPIICLHRFRYVPQETGIYVGMEIPIWDECTDEANTVCSCGRAFCFMHIAQHRATCGAAVSV